MYGSLSLRRAWIEIEKAARVPARGYGSLSLRRAWIEIAYPVGVMQSDTSLSLRRAWIEIYKDAADLIKRWVALLTESVD